MLRYLPGVVIVFVAGACSAAAERDRDLVPCARESALIGGDPASLAQFASVGSLGRMRLRGYSAFCSATLIAPDLIVTAKHCKMFTEAPLFFTLGESADAPERIVAVREWHVSEPAEGGVTQLGSDIAVGRLAEAITNVAAMPILRTPPDALIGTSLTALGFGISDTSCGGDSAGLRRLGEQVVTRARGNVFDIIYGDRETFLAATLRSRPLAAAEQRYRSGHLLDGYEVWVEPGQRQVQICRGDSGGPLVRMSGLTPQLVGVSSWVWHSDEADCDYGAVIAVIGPRTWELLARLAVSGG